MKFKKANKPKLNHESQQPAANRREEPFLNSRLRSKLGLPDPGNRNLVSLKIVKRFSKCGQMWVDKLLAQSREPPLGQPCAQDSREFANQLTLCSGAPEDKIGQMRLKRYGEFEDLLCFEDREESLDATLGKEQSLAANFKAFMKLKKSA